MIIFAWSCALAYGCFEAFNHMHGLLWYFLLGGVFSTVLIPYLGTCLCYGMGGDLISAICYLFSHCVHRLPPHGRIGRTWDFYDMIPHWSDKTLLPIYQMSKHFKPVNLSLDL